VRLNLGALDRPIEGFLSVDICEPADIVCDLRGPWSFPDSSVDEVFAADVFEHLPDKIHTMNELWRVLKPGGRAVIQVPHATDGDGGHCDPTHKSLWTTSDFEYYSPGFAERERFRCKGEYARILADFRVVSMAKTRHPRRWGGHVVEIQAVLEAVKA
jgi:trans-aconitate methyltransferase